MQALADSVCPNSESINGNSQFLGKAFAMINLCLLFLLIVANDKIAAVFRELPKTAFEALVFRFNVLSQIDRTRRLNCGRGNRVFQFLSKVSLSEVFEMHFVGNAVKILHRVSGKIRSDFTYPGDDSINRFVGEILSFGTAATSEDLNKPQPDRFVSLAGALAIGVQPIEQAIEGILS